MIDAGGIAQMKAGAVVLNSPAAAWSMKPRSWRPSKPVNCRTMCVIFPLQFSPTRQA